MYILSLLLQILSGLAYLGLCALLVSASAQHKLKSILRQIPEETAEGPVPHQFSHEPDHLNKKAGRAAPCLYLPATIFSVVLLVFTCIPFGILPSLLNTGLEGLIAVAILALTSRDMAHDGVAIKHTQGWNLACLVFILGVFAWHRQQSGIPGELFSLDAYVAFPAMEGMRGYGKAGVLLLAAMLLILLLSLQKKMAALLLEFTHSNQNSMFFQLFIHEAWLMAVMAIWVCLFMPDSLSHGFGLKHPLGTVADAAVFWAKVLGCNYFLWHLRDKLPANANLPRIALGLGVIGSIAVFLS